MLAGWTGKGFGAVVAVAITIGSGSAGHTAEAARYKSGRAGHSVAAAHAGKFHTFSRYSRRASLRRWAGALQCVPFARENSGIELSGNAGTWWDSADGLYERGARPEVGSILNFRSSGRMRMGHVAVVTNVIDSRHIEIDHANWSGPGRISRDIDVVDVSPNNDWTAVRVALPGADDEFGSTYPTYGFIYDRPDTGVMTANRGVVPGPATVHPVGATMDLAAATTPEEVAEAAEDDTPRATRHRSSRYHISTRFRAHTHAAARGLVYRVASRSALIAPHHHRRRS